MDLAIPNHLKHYLKLIGNENDEYQVLGTLKCKCGSESFYIYHSNNKMIVEAVCSSCNKELILFDEGKHGWNGFVCNDDFLNREEPLKLNKCTKCNESRFKIQVRVTSQGKQDFIDESGLKNGFGETLNESDWVDAFEWISANIICLSCNKQEENWLDCETM